MEHRIEIVSAERLNELGVIILIGNHFASYGGERIGEFRGPAG